jgi:hypothetical protein
VWERGKDGAPAADSLLANSGFPSASLRAGSPVSLRSRVGMTTGVGSVMATFEESTFVGMRASWIGTILLTVMGSGEIILI